MKTIPRTIEKVCKLLHITPDAYINLFFDNGCEYLEQNQTGRADELQRLIKAFICSPSFWQWYCLQAEVIDAVFISAVRKDQTPRTIEAYKLMQIRRQLAIHQNVIDAVIEDERKRLAKTVFKQAV
uniref:hypothetical protein n=1 Tax=uncultured Draconibacterium sp. TaxID=1573823 RepID=UPI00321791F1